MSAHAEHPMPTVAAIRVAPVDHHDPRLTAWVDTLKARCPHFSHNLDLPTGAWLGVYILGTLRAAIGFTRCINDVILVEYVVCEPSRLGYRAMVLLLGAMREQWRTLTVRFFSEAHNRRIHRIVEHLGARRVAVMHEIPADKEQ